MEFFLDNLAKKYYDDHRADFPADAIYGRFFVLEGTLAARNVYPSTAFGYIAYELHGERRMSNRIRVQYLNYDQLQPNLSPVVGHWFINEANFYGSVWPRLRSTIDETPGTSRPVPNFYGGTTHKTVTGYWSAIMLEHPRAHLNFANGRCLDWKHLSAMARKLGQFHGCVLRHAATKGAPTLMEGAGLKALYSEQHCLLVRPKLIECLQPLRDDWRYGSKPTYTQGVKRLAAMINQLHSFIAATSQGPRRCRVLCHMNYTQGNVFFKYDGTDVVDLLIGNWTTADHCSVAADLVALLFVEAPAKIVHKSRMELVGAYYDELTKFCPKVCLPPLREVVQEVKRCVPIALFLLADKIGELNIAPCLSRRIVPSASKKPKAESHWNDAFLTSIFRTLISKKFV